MMINFVRSLVPIMESSTVKVFFYQVGTFCPAPVTDPLPLFVRLLRDVVVKVSLGGGTPPGRSRQSN